MNTKPYLVHPTARQSRLQTATIAFVLVAALTTAACTNAHMAGQEPTQVAGQAGGGLAGPYIAGWALDGLSIRWESKSGCKGTSVSMNRPDGVISLPVTRVWADRKPEYGASICQAKLPRLADCQNVPYSFVHQGEARREFSFKAPPKPGEICPGGMKIAIIGDSRTHHDIHAKLAAAIRKYEPHFLMHNGDLVDHTERIHEWRKFFAVQKEILSRVLFAVAPGNHEVLPEGDKSASGARRMDRYFKTQSGGGVGHYTLDFGVVHLIVLDTYFGEQLDNGGMDWLKGHLKSLPEDRIVIVLLHEPPVSFGKYDPGVELRYLRRVLLENDVDAVFAGHQHLYEHFKIGGTHFVTSGGGGAELHQEWAGVKEDQRPWLRMHKAVHQWFSLEIEEDRKMLFKAIDIDGNVLEEWTVDRRP